MSFATDLLALLKGDAAINAAVSGVYYQILPDNTAITSKNIVFTFSLNDSIDHLDRNNEIDIYSLRIAVLAADTNDSDTIVNLIRTYLDNYTDSKFADIKLQNIETETEGEREQFVTVLTFKVWYYSLFTGTIQQYNGNRDIFIEVEN